MVKRREEDFSQYCSNHPRAKTEPPSCCQYKPGTFLAKRQQNWEEIIHGDDDDERWADPGPPRSGCSHHGDGSHNDDDEGEEET